MPFIKCPSCGSEIQSSSSECMYCKFDMSNYDRDTRIKVIVQDPNVMPLGSSVLTIYNNATGELIADVRLGEIFYLKITEPTEILVTKTAWRKGKAVLRAKPNATYKIMLKSGFLTSKIVIKDITDCPEEAGCSHNVIQKSTKKSEENSQETAKNND